ncbi:hypothetical protein RhiirA1_515780 [Rhizophagus irregularis]|uniref:CCHC-type domain-containing protein n=2 Tax=Rhizophagus irregularis TaxID=588596 RepID=A0A2N0RNN7_9GLOM|nr:hypothetical protein RhiirA1_515780 [Rhizophagus irregularis]
MSNITTRSKAKATDKRTLDDTEIVKEVYSVNKDTQNNTMNEDNDRPNKIRNIETSDNTEAMEVEFENNSSSSHTAISHDSNERSTNEPMETDKVTISIPSDQQNNSNPIKGKNKETLQIEQIDYNDSETQNTATESFSVFIAKDQFPNEGSRRIGRFAPKQPQYKTVYIEFRTTAGAKYLIERGWSLDIEDFNIKILPTNNHEAYIQRTSKGYRITGLPNNTDVKDMNKILSLINGETCSIPKARSRYCSKTAYVMVDPKNFEDKIKKITAFNTSLYIIPLDNKVKTCVQCGSPEHMIQDCTTEHTVTPNGKKFFKPINIPRNTTKIVVSKSISDNYGSIMKINEDFNKQKTPKISTKSNQSNNKNPSNQQQQWAQRQIINYNQSNNTPRPRQNINNHSIINNNINDSNSPNFSLEIATLNDKIKWAEKMIKDLEKQVDDQKKEIEQLKVFAKEVFAHNNYIKESMDKMVGFQQHMTEIDLVKDAQLKEILIAVKGPPQQYYQEHHNQEQQLQIQYVPE